MRTNTLLVALALMVIAGAIASGLGQVAAATNGGFGNFPQVVGSWIMAIGCLLFVLTVLRGWGKGDD